jgi:hypothetical protein
MNEIGIEGIYPKRSINTSIGNKEHKIYPYLLEGLEINRINLVVLMEIRWVDMDLPC